MFKLVLASEKETFVEWISNKIRYTIYSDKTTRKDSSKIKNTKKINFDQTIKKKLNKDKSHSCLKDSTESEKFSSEGKLINNPNSSVHTSSSKSQKKI